MRHLILLSFCMTISVFLSAQDEFITKWKIEKDGELLTIPVQPGYDYDYQVDWGDGSNTENFDENAKHNYQQTGDYEVKISGEFPSIYLDNKGDKDKLLEIKQWGDIQWESMNSAFSGANNMQYSATDVPDLSLVTDMSNMFNRCNTFNGFIDNWDVSKVTLMNDLFHYAWTFNQPLNSWKVDKVTDMSSMFSSAGVFNRPLDKWNVSNVSNMSAMFLFAVAFDQELNSWDVSKVTDMGAMFFVASSFDRPLHSWNVESVTEMGSIFLNAQSFDRSLAEWNIRNVTSLEYAFLDSGISADNYDATLKGWNSITDPLQRDVTVGSRGLIYCFSTAERQALIDNYNWTFDGDVECVSTQRPFITTWQIDDVSKELTINANPGFDYNFSIDWNNDGIIEQADVKGSISHTYLTPGIYEVAIYGDFPAPYLNFDLLQKEKLIEIKQWGDIEWKSMQDAFNGAYNMTYDANDVPDLSMITDMSNMFRGCSNFNGDIDNWDVSKVTNMKHLFLSASSFNQPLNSWVVTSVLDMTGMFEGASSFNKPLNSWNVSKVTSMTTMFGLSSSFNQDLNNWEVGSVTGMGGMFTGANTFNSPLDSWDVSNVTDMAWIFLSASSFDQSLADWNISSVASFRLGLSASGLSTDNYDATLLSWATQDVMNGVELGAFGLEYCGSVCARQSLIDFHGWVFDGDSLCTRIPFITTWNIKDASEPLIINVNPAFSYNYSIDWDNDGIIDKTDVTGAISHEYPIAGTYKVAIYGDFPAPYLNSDPLQSDKLLEINQWGNKVWKSMERAFAGANNMIYTAEDIPYLSMVTDMSYMFSGCSIFDGNISNWDVSNVDNMRYMFSEASSFNQALDTWAVDSVFTMTWMFSGATSFDQPVNSWNTSEVQYMSGMFNDATSFNQDLNNWVVSKVESMNSMFKGATKFNKPLDVWDVSQVESFSSMFNDASSFNQPLDTWVTSNATYMSSTFSGAASFDRELDSWDVDSVVSMVNMLDDSGLSIENYDRILISWSSQDVQVGLNLGANELQYCGGERSRQSLIDDFNWTFSGDMKGGVANTYIGPDIGGWNSGSHWSTGSTAEKCDDAKVGDDKTVFLDDNAACLTLEVAAGASLEIDGFILVVGTPEIDDK